VPNSNFRTAILFWAMLILLVLCATFRSGRDGFAALVAPNVFGIII